MSVNPLLSAGETLLKRAPEETIELVENGNWIAALKAALPANAVVFSGLHYKAELENAGFRVWCGVEAEPCTDTVNAMAEFLCSVNPDAVAAVGGGSVMDAAKAAWLMKQTGCSLDELWGVNRWSSAHPGMHLKRLVAVPTTSGTGSEATPYANIVDRKLAVKKLISEGETVPERAILAPGLTFSMPQALTRATGCDALAHLIEGFLNVGADAKAAFANEYALTGIKLIVQYLPQALKDPTDGEARRAMTVASALGGMTIRFKSTGLPHLCSFSWFGRIAHGDAVVLLLPACWRYYLGNPDVAARTMELADVFPGTTPEEVIASFRDFLSAVGEPASLAAYPDITAEVLERTARGGAQNKMKLELAPRPVPLEQSYEVLHDILAQC